MTNWDRATYEALQEDSIRTELLPDERLRAEVASLRDQNESLQESMAEVRAMMAYEDQGWKLIAGVASGERLEGLEIDEVNEIAAKISPRVAAGMPKRAVDLHAGFVFGRGCYIEGTEKPKGAGRPSGIRRFYTDTVNQETLFSETAREELQKARFITGNVLLACNTRTKNVNRIPFNQVTNIKVDPNFPENVIAYQRTWDTKDGTNDSVKKRWYYTKRYTGTKVSYYADGAGGLIPVDRETIIVDLRANRQVGHVLGIPDGLAGLHWAEAYGQIIQYGQVVNESLAKILYKVTNKTKAGVQSTGVKVSNFSGHGGTASMVEGQELSAVSTAGRGYDFSAARPVAAMAAMAWNVSNMDLLNDSSAAGSSYGSANALVPGNRNAMILMQKEWSSVFQDVFEVMGFERPRITWEPLETPDQYRSAQALTLLSTTLHDEEYRMKALDIMDIVGESSDIPETLKMRSQPEQTAAQQSAPDQGRSSGTGTGNGDSGGQGANDLRSDSINSENLRHEMANEDYLNRLEDLVSRLEIAKEA